MMRYLYDEKCVLNLQGKDVECIAYRHIVKGSIFVRYVKAHSITQEVLRESVAEALVRKAYKYGATLEIPDKAERYCGKRDNGTVCGGYLLRSRDKVDGHYMGICSECGGFVQSYDRSYTEVPNKSFTYAVTTKQLVDAEKKLKAQMLEYKHIRDDIERETRQVKLDKKLKLEQNLLKSDNSTLSMTYNKITTVEELKNRIAELAPSIITQVELGRAVIGIKLGNPSLSYAEISEQVGIREYRLVTSVRAVRYPMEVQELILADKVTLTVCDSLIPICDYPYDVPLKLFTRVIEDKLIFSEARALCTILQNITDIISKNDVVYTEEQLCAMYDRAIYPVKTEPESPASVANTIIESVLGIRKEEEEVALALVPAQVQTGNQYKEVSVKPQPYYLKSKQSDFNKVLSRKTDATVVLARTDKGFTVDVECTDSDIPQILTALYGAKPLDEEVYSDSPVDVENQTVQILNSNFSCLDESYAKVLIHQIRSNTGIVSCNIQPSNAKQMTSYTLKDNSIYHIISPVLFDIAEQVHVVCLDGEGTQIKVIID